MSEGSEQEGGMVSDGHLSLTLTVNGTKREAHVDPRTTLLDLLREGGTHAPFRPDKSHDARSAI